MLNMVDCLQLVARQNYVWQMRASNEACSGSGHQILMRITGNTPQVSRKVVLATQDMARRTCFREQYYTGTRNYYCARKIGASNLVKLCVNLYQFSFNNLRLMCSFGLALCVDLGMINFNGWKPVRCPGKSMSEILGQNKVVLNMIILRISWFGDVSGPPKTSPGPKIAHWRATPLRGLGSGGPRAGPLRVCWTSIITGRFQIF